MTRIMSMTTSERLAQYLLDGVPGDRLILELTAWLTASKRFRDFADAHRDKIRKKLRTATDPEARRDVRAELLAARLLLGDRRLELAFEAYGSRQRGPDFTVSFGGERRFNIEVTRLRGAPADATHGGPLLAKLRQLPPGVPNALLIAVEGRDAGALDVASATRAMRDRADAKDEDFFVSRGFDGTRDFYHRFLRLGAVVVWCEAASPDARATQWLNRSSRIGIPERAIRACLVSLRAGDPLVS